MAIASKQSSFHGVANLVGLGLPGSQANGRDLVARVEGISLPTIDRN